MKGLLVIPKNEKEKIFLIELLEKLGYPSRELTDEEVEDLGLLTAMLQEKKGEYVSEEEVRKALEKK